RVYASWDLGEEYGVTDADGTRPHFLRWLREDEPAMAAKWKKLDDEFHAYGGEMPYGTPQYVPSRLKRSAPRRTVAGGPFPGGASCRSPTSSPRRPDSRRYRESWASVKPTPPGELRPWGPRSWAGSRSRPWRSRQVSRDSAACLDSLAVAACSMTCSLRSRRTSRRVTMSLDRSSVPRTSAAPSPRARRRRQDWMPGSSSGCCR